MTAAATILGETERPVRVMVVDDSAVVRGLITRQLAASSAIEVTASAPNGQAALEQLGRREVDVVVLDIEMPVMDGLTALPLILAAHPRIKVIMASTLTRRNAEISLRALQLGASDYVAKPENGLASAEAFHRELIAKVKALGALATAPRPASISIRSPLIISAARRAQQRVPPTALAIGASTGGPPALLKLFEALKGGVKQPIFLTQHMPPTFTSLLAEQLSQVGGRPCQEGRDGDTVVPGRCYVAPGGWHMTVEVGSPGPVIRLNQDPPENYCRPAVDPMFRSLSKVYGAGLVGVILTGMGADGAAGCTALCDAGGVFIAQEEATSEVWGMPGAAAGTGRAEQILPLGGIGPWLRATMGDTV